MKLTYRGQAYEMSAPIQSDSNLVDQPLKLVYRGHTYDYIPRSVEVPKAVAAGESTVTLIYRGNTYSRQLRLSKSYQQPRVINWRYVFSKSPKIGGFRGPIC